MRAQWRYTVTISASFESWICRVRSSEVDATNVSVRQSHLEIDPVSRHRVHDEHHAHYGERHDRPAPQAALLLPGT